MYDLELENAVKAIRTAKAKLVLIQLPDGLKPKAKEIQETLRQRTTAEILIWAGSAFGACDIPRNTEQLGIDLVIQWGHSELA
jgi:diphthamide biosynthesis enzyme Dph1/Dph2-like protein